MSRNRGRRHGRGRHVALALSRKVGDLSSSRAVSEGGRGRPAAPATPQRCAGSHGVEELPGDGVGKVALERHGTRCEHGHVALPRLCRETVTSRAVLPIPAGPSLTRWWRRNRPLHARAASAATQARLPALCRAPSRSPPDGAGRRRFRHAIRWRRRNPLFCRLVSKGFRCESSVVGADAERAAPDTMPRAVAASLSRFLAARAAGAPAAPLPSSSARCLSTAVGNGSRS